MSALSFCVSIDVAAVPHRQYGRRQCRRPEAVNAECCAKQEHDFCRNEFQRPGVRPVLAPAGNIGGSRASETSNSK
jgi:hypothetical protein